MHSMYCSSMWDSPVIASSCAWVSGTEEDSQPVRSFKLRVAAAARRRWDLDSLDVTQVPLLATALDPRFHHLICDR